MGRIMNPLTLITNAITGITKPVAGIFEKREERKKTKVIAEAKIAQTKVEGGQKITLTDAEWESISQKNQNDTWKDEYVTIIITWPYVGIFAGAVWLAFTGDDRLLTGVNTGIQSLKALGVDMGYLMTAVVLAALGLKMWRNK